MFKQIKIALMKAVGLHVENRAPVRPFVAQPFPLSDRPGIENNNASLGGVPEVSCGRDWAIDWDSPHDPLRRAILGQGPKRPFGR